MNINLDLTNNLDLENCSRSDDIATSGDDNVIYGGDFRGRQCDIRQRLLGPTTWFPAATSGNDNVVFGCDFRGRQRDIRQRFSYWRPSLLHLALTLKHTTIQNTHYQFKINTTNSKHTLPIQRPVVPYESSVRNTRKVDEIRRHYREMTAGLAVWQLEP